MFSDNEKNDFVQMFHIFYYIVSLYGDDIKKGLTYYMAT